jgi:spore photoproduct lyase
VSEHFLALKEENPFRSQDSDFWLLAEEYTKEHAFSYSQVRQICLWVLDSRQWGCELNKPHNDPPLSRQEFFAQLKKHYQDLQKERNYNVSPLRRKIPPAVKVPVTSPKRILGDCPVASTKTRCCNLQTLDAVTRCAYDCTYCSIQAFYHQNQVQFAENLEESLGSLELDPEEYYHIGTGQSSDSLVWGNHEGLLEQLFTWAQANPNVVLELKTKSAKIKEALALGIPRNVLTTWSLNPQRVIDWEEGGTASLDQRLDAARAVAESGAYVGFHFHPIITYQGWEKDYLALSQRLQDAFDPQQVVTLSFGSLTYSKKVINQIRGRKIRTRILQMPLVEAAGKWSLPLEEKVKIFSSMVNSFAPWRSKVYFYLCMEDPRLWPQVFGWDYPDNKAFQSDMISHYRQKMGL